MEEATSKRVRVGEYWGKEVQRRQKPCPDGLSTLKKKIVIIALNEGASNQYVMENRSLVGQVLFDWLDEVFYEARSALFRGRNARCVGVALEARPILG